MLTDTLATLLYLEKPGALTGYHTLKKVFHRKEGPYWKIECKLNIHIQS